MVCKLHLAHRAVSSNLWGSLQAWEIGGGGAVAKLIAFRVTAVNTATSSPPPNFWTCGKSHKLDDTVLYVGPSVRPQVDLAYRVRPLCRVTPQLDLTQWTAPMDQLCTWDAVDQITPVH